MELTRRDALAALGTLGVVGSGVAALKPEPPVAGVPNQSLDVGTLAAVADVVYPTAVTGVEAFVETYSLGRVRERPAYAAGVAAAVRDLDDSARDWYGAPYADLALDVRERLLRELGTHTADPDPDGTTAERLRYYLVNELLFALYASPVGGRLVGVPNPQGHPGGLGSYGRKPDR